MVPHAEGDQDAQSQADEAMISNLLSNKISEDINLDFENRELETGEKADDAVDYGDIASSRRLIVVST